MCSKGDTDKEILYETFRPGARAWKMCTQQKAKSFMSMIWREGGCVVATAGENRAQQPGMASDTTTNLNNGLIDGQTNGWHRASCIRVHAYRAHTENTCLIPASAPGSCCLAVLKASFFVFFTLFLFSPSWWSHSSFQMSDSVCKNTEKVVM